MARHRGRGMAAINYPIGMNLGGDPSQALVHSNPDGKFTVALSSIDLGQGMKQVTRQIAAETLGVPVEDVYVDTADSDTGPHCMGSFASRGTHRVGNAVIAAAREARGVHAGGRRRGARGQCRRPRHRRARQYPRQGAPSPLDHRHGTPRSAAQFKQGKTISGRGIFLIPLSDGRSGDRRDDRRSPAFAHACLVAEVEVDDETGEVDRAATCTSAYELGRALNPRLVEQQLVGGAWMGMSHALFETPEPYYPDPEPWPARLQRVPDAGPRRHRARIDIAVLERPAPDGPFGGKGPGEMCANPVLPAVANAIFDAVGVRIDELPITPEKVLRGIQRAWAARGRRQGAGG